jgi:hypothetical protein
MSASGKFVRKGEVIHDRAPDIRWEEIEWGEKIGGGCFGSVYKGKCRGINVAIKVLPELFFSHFFLSNYSNKISKPRLLKTLEKKLTS